MATALEILRLANADEALLHRSAQTLALKLAPGDVIALRGGLGVGKTSFARAVIRALAGDQEHEVPSPSYAIAQAYDETRIPVTHFDWYRLTDPSELEEIGFAWRDSADDAGAAKATPDIGVAIVEWPERAAAYLPASYLEIVIAEPGQADAIGAPADTAERRDITMKLVGADIAPDRRARLERFAALFAFIEHGRGVDREAASDPLIAIAHVNGDASARSYARLRFASGETAIVMDSPAMPDGPELACGRPYSRVAHLAETIIPFIAIGDALARTGLSVPAVQSLDTANGFARIADLGEEVFDRIAAGDTATRATRTQAALDALLHLRAYGPPPAMIQGTGNAGGLTHRLPQFDLAAMQAECDLLLQWAWPVYAPSAGREEAAAAFRAAWDAVLGTVASTAEGWVLRDYHAPNLIWCAGRSSVERVGMIDFQDAMRGSWAYDVVSVIQDARCDIPAALRADLRDHYCRQAARQFAEFNAEVFGEAFAILGAQRATKIVGIFHRLAARDHKPGYLRHLPRVTGYLAENLHHGALEPVRDWFKTHVPTLAPAALHDP